MGRRSGSYPAELSDRVVRMVAEVRPDYPPGWPAICAVAQQLGIGTAETLCKSVRQAECVAVVRTVSLNRHVSALDCVGTYVRGVSACGKV